MSELDVRLAEIGRRLEEIQVGLAPDVEFTAAAAPAIPAPPASEAAPAPAPEPPAPEPPAAVPPAESVPDEPPAVELSGPWPGEPPSSPRSGPLAALLARSRRRRPDGAADDLAALVRMHNGLITALAELVRLLGDQAAGAQPAATVSAGPFRTPEEVEAFAARLSELAPVRATTIIGYEGADRALIEVQLEDSSG